MSLLLNQDKPVHKMPLHSHRVSYDRNSMTNQQVSRRRQSNESSDLIENTEHNFLSTYKSATQRFNQLDESKNSPLKFHNQVKQMNRAATASLVQASEDQI